MSSIGSPDGILTLNRDGTIDILLEEGLVRLRRPKASEYRDMVAAAEMAEEAEKERLASTRQHYLQECIPVLQQLQAAATESQPFDPEPLRQLIELFTKAADADEQRDLSAVFGEMPYLPFWQEVFKRLLGRKVTADDIEAWMLSPTAVGLVIAHWSQVPLALGLTPAQKAAIEGRPMTEAEKMADGIL